MTRLPATILLAAFLAHGSRALGQQAVTGRYYPEKPEYLVGEPIIFDFEVVNHSPKVGEIAESNCDDLGPGPFEVDGVARKKDPAPFGCGRIPFSPDCLIGGSEIPAGGKYRTRLFLNGPFVLNSPGTYRVRARKSQTIGRPDSNEVLAQLSVVSLFEVTLREPQQGELKDAYKAFFKDMKNKNPMIRDFAASAITQNPPVFAEGVISALAVDAITGTARAEGLGRLGTPTARAKLIEMASSGSEEFRQPAIQALGELGNPDDCQSMLDIGNQNTNYTQAEAYMYAARICKQRAIPAFLHPLPNADSQLDGYLAVAFANTQSRDAIPPLIGLLANTNEGVRSDAEDALETLTHRKSRFGTASAEASNDSRTEWTNWWAAQAITALIYGPDRCADPQPLD
ncbi:MAG TPA: HEAT repeat domain-containing protein [Candidatus Cybelea sp.]|nr:HEAT repeat domain-containing protein [Candidatus Cybelea sp.]